jgi:two-component system, cell cycle sensor histidine kinase and response regulator CckA
MPTSRYIRVLLVEDSQSDAELFEIYLEQVRSADYQIEVAETLADGIAALASRSVDIVLADLNLPDSFGIDTCRKLHAAAPSVPIIVLTGLADEEKALEAMQVGAQDYLVKGEIDGNVLSRAIRYSIERQRAVDMQRQSNDRMRLITEQLPAVLWTTDTDLRITPPSSNFLINESDGETLIGRTLNEFFETSDDKFAPIAAHRRAARGEPVSIEFFWRGRTLSIHVEPLRDGGGNIIGQLVSRLMSAHRSECRTSWTPHGMFSRRSFLAMPPTFQASILPEPFTPLKKRRGTTSTLSRWRKAAGGPSLATSPATGWGRRC